MTKPNPGSKETSGIAETARYILLKPPKVRKESYDYYYPKKGK